MSRFPVMPSGSRCERPATGTLDGRSTDRHDRGHPARGGGGRNRLEQLPGEPLDGRASEDVRLGERGPGRIHESVELGEHPDADRCFRLHSVGRRSAPRRDGPCDVLRAAVPRRVQARLPGVAPHGPVQRPLVTSVPVRDAPVPAGRDPGGGSADGRRRGVGGTGRTYIQRATKYVLAVVLFATSLFFAGISTKLNRTRLRGVILGVGCVVFFLAASWIATFPISLSI